MRMPKVSDVLSPSPSVGSYCVDTALPKVSEFLSPYQSVSTDVCAF